MPPKALQKMLSCALQKMLLRLSRQERLLSVGYLLGASSSIAHPHDLDEGWVGRMGSKSGGGAEVWLGSTSQSSEKGEHRKPYRTRTADSGSVAFSSTWSSVGPNPGRFLGDPRLRTSGPHVSPTSLFHRLFEVPQSRPPVCTQAFGAEAAHEEVGRQGRRSTTLHNKHASGTATGSAASPTDPMATRSGNARFCLNGGVRSRGRAASSDGGGWPRGGRQKASWASIGLTPGEARGAMRPQDSAPPHRAMKVAAVIVRVRATNGPFGTGNEISWHQVRREPVQPAQREATELIPWVPKAGQISLWKGGPRGAPQGPRKRAAGASCRPPLHGPLCSPFSTHTSSNADPPGRTNKPWARRDRRPSGLR